MNDLDTPNFNERATILVVDDTPDNLTLMSNLLKDQYKVKVANSGEKALKFLEGENKTGFDTSFFDIMMPGLSGYDVIRELKDNPSTHDIPVIFLTAMSAAEDKKRARTGGSRLHHKTHLPSHRYGACQNTA